MNSAFVDAYEQFHGQIFGWFRNQGFQILDAEDLTAETFTRALQSMATYDVNRSSIRTWLFMKARDVRADFGRDRAHSPTVEPNVEQGSDDDVRDLWEIAYETRQLQSFATGAPQAAKVLVEDLTRRRASLGAEDCKIFDLSAGGHSEAEITAQLDMPRSRVRESAGRKLYLEILNEEVW